MILIAVILAVFTLNLPFGYWRSTTRKFSLHWVLSVHLPVPGVIALRIFSGLGWQLYTFPLLIGAFFTGQYVGSRLHRWFEQRSHANATGCLVMDVYHSLKQN
ncbi:MAG: hypothetical protein WBQ23_09865 [Bacteroidota bacterium]